MSRRSEYRIFRLLTLILPVIWLTGCVEYTIETTLNPDGSGFRDERMDAAESEDVAVAPEDFPSLMYAGAEEGWTHTEEVDDDGDLYHRFLRHTEAPDLAAWSGLSDRIRISGTIHAIKDNRIGHMRLGEVRFHNDVHVRTAADSDGNMSFAFRETFTWDRAVDALGEFLMADLEEALGRDYRKLSFNEIGQIVGFARARFWVAVEEGLLSGDADEDQLLSEAALRTAEQAVKVVQVQYPEATEEALVELLTEVLVDTDERLLAFLEESLPGLNIALNSEIIFRLNMPGRITDSNAHKRDGTTLVWKFGPGDALYTPVEIYAESVLGG